MALSQGDPPPAPLDRREPGRGGPEALSSLILLSRHAWVLRLRCLHCHPSALLLAVPAVHPALIMGDLGMDSRSLSAPGAWHPHSEPCFQLCPPQRFLPQSTSLSTAVSVIPGATPFPHSQHWTKTSCTEGFCSPGTQCLDLCRWKSTAPELAAKSRKPSLLLFAPTPADGLAVGLPVLKGCPSQVPALARLLHPMHVSAAPSMHVASSPCAWMRNIDAPQGLS